MANQPLSPEVNQVLDDLNAAATAAVQAVPGAVEQVRAPQDVPPALVNAGEAALQAASDALARRGYLKTEVYLPLIGLAISAVLAHFGVAPDLISQAVLYAGPVVAGLIVSTLLTLQKRLHIKAAAAVVTAQKS